MLVVLQVTGFLNSSCSLEGQVPGEVQVPRAAGKIVTVSGQNCVLTVHRSRTGQAGLMLQHVDVSRVL